jgi:hypothetical protein
MLLYFYCLREVDTTGYFFQFPIVIANVVRLSVIMSSVVAPSLKVERTFAKLPFCLTIDISLDRLINAVYHLSCCEC